MRLQTLTRLLALALVLTLVTLGCRREDETPPIPTPLPTAALPDTRAPDTDGAPANTPTPRPQPTATAVPQPAVNADAIDWPPQLVYSSPAPGEEVLLDGAITLRFDQPMDPDSVESAFAVTDAGGSRIAGEFSWPRPDTLVFTPRSLRRQADYRVQIADTAEAVNGRPLRSPIDLSLQTVGFLEVGQVIPAADTAAVDTDSSITVFFNRPVVPVVTSAQQAGLPQPLTITPAVAGSGEWVSSSIYRFLPADPLAGATTYTVSVAEGLADVAGAVLEEGFTWTFTTRSPEVVTIDPANNATGVVPTRPITITFNMPMDPASTEAAVLLPGVDVGNTAVDFSWQDDNRILVLTPRQPLQLDTEYQVTIGASAAAASGQATLAQDEVSAFSTVPFPAVLYTTPARNAVADTYANGVSIGFASPMDLSTFEDNIVIEPEPARTNSFWNEFNNELYLNFALARNTTYRVTIPGDAADPYGNTLGEAYTWQFDTPDYPPIASFNLPQQVSQLSTSFVTEVGIIHRNVSSLDVSLTDLGLPLGLLINPFDLYDYRPAAEPRQTWSLPPEEDGLATLALAGDGTLPTGVYYLAVNTPELQQETRYWQNQRHLLVVADTNIVVKEMIDEVHVWVTDLGSGQPAAGRSLALYNVRGVQTATAVSDADGFASFPREPVDYLEGVLVVSGQPGAAGFGVANSNWSQGVRPWDFDVNVNTSPETNTFAYLYTDRPIYRPGDTVYFKGIVRQSDYGRYLQPDGGSVRMTLNPAFFLEDQGLSETFTFDLSPDGSFNGSYTLPEDVTLGTYQLNIDGQDYPAMRQFTVAEYRRPEFLVSLAPDRAEALRGDTVQVTLEARYFFGGAAADLPVNWSIYEAAYYPDLSGAGRFSFGDNANFFYEPFSPFFGGGGEQGTFIRGGEARTDANGRVTLTLPADLLQDADAGSRRVTVEVNVLDLSNFAVSSRTTVIFHAAEAYVGVTPTDYASRAGTETAVDLLTTDWDGRPLANQDVEVVFYQREWQRTRSTDFGTYLTIWEPVDTEVARAQVQTNAQGQASASFTPDFGGSYLAVATVTDADGRQQTSSTYLWIVDPAFSGWRTDPRERRMELVRDQDAYAPGDVAQVLVQSPFDGPVLAWLTIERGQLIEQELITLQTSSDILEIPLPPAYAPNVHVTVTALKPVTPGTDDPYADLRIGIVELPVSIEQLVLDVQLTPRQENFAPRDTVTYDIRVTDYAGQPVEAELSLALVDLAVLTLKPDNAPPIAEAFYAPQPLRSQMGSGLIVSGEGLEPEIPLETGGFGGGGGGDVAEEALSRVPGDEDETVRRDFPDTAFWEAVVQTDENGRAAVDVPLPDTLTTWRLSSKAVTDDTRVGQASVDIVTSLPLLIRPVTPRFFTVGDVVELGAIVNNNTGSAIEATVSLEAAGLSGSLADQTVSVPANGQQIVRWEVTVNDVTTADLTFRVRGGDFSDATKPGFGVGPDNLIPVYRYDAEEVVGAAGVLAERDRRVEAVLLPPTTDERRGSVDVTLSPSLAAALITALEAQEELPYDSSCAHAIANRLLPNAVTAAAIRELELDQPALLASLDALIPQEIADIVDLRLSGGWGWCYSIQRSTFLSAYILFALAQADLAGYEVPAGVLADGGEMLGNLLEDPADLRSDYEIDRQIFVLYVMHLLGEEVPVLYDRHVSENRDLMSPYAKALLAEIYADTGFTPENLDALLADLNDAAILSATGAHWEDDSPQYWQNLSTDVRTTAIVVHALARLDPDSALLPNAVRWLMAARQVDHWPTTHETAWSILALTRWMAATGELQADYSYALAVNLQPEIQGDFTPQTVLENEFTSIPAADLALGDVNYVEISRGEGNGRLYYTLHLDSFFAAADAQPLSRGVTVQRTYYDATCDPEAETCEPITRIAAGQQVRVELTVIAPTDQVYLVVRDPIPSGAEAVDPGLATSGGAAGAGIRPVSQDYRYGYWGWWYFNRIEFRDEQVVFFAEFLPAGTYQYTYTLQATIPGAYQVMPATARQEFFPEVFGRSAGLLFTID